MQVNREATPQTVLLERTLWRSCACRNSRSSVWIWFSPLEKVPAEEQSKLRSRQDRLWALRPEMRKEKEAATAQFFLSSASESATNSLGDHLVCSFTMGRKSHVSQMSKPETTENRLCGQVIVVCHISKIWTIVKLLARIKPLYLPLLSILTVSRKRGQITAPGAHPPTSCPPAPRHFPTNFLVTLDMGFLFLLTSTFFSDTNNLLPRSHWWQSTFLSLSGFKEHIPTKSVI